MLLPDADGIRVPKCKVRLENEMAIYGVPERAETFKLVVICEVFPILWPLLILSSQLLIHAAEIRSRGDTPANRATGGLNQIQGNRGSTFTAGWCALRETSCPE